VPLSVKICDGWGRANASRSGSLLLDWRLLTAASAKLGLWSIGTSLDTGRLRSFSGGPKAGGGSNDMLLIMRMGSWTETSDARGPVEILVSSIKLTSISLLRAMVRAKG
jgi:hypothetical protein